jgi:hypothetical protein
MKENLFLNSKFFLIVRKENFTGWCDIIPEKGTSEKKLVTDSKKL